MTTITQNVADIAGVPDDGTWTFFSELREGSDGDSIVTPHRVRVEPVAGVLTVELDPGPAIVLVCNQRYEITIPDTDTDLWSLIELAIAVPPSTSHQTIADAVEAYLESNASPFGVDLMTAGDAEDARVVMGVDHPGVEDVRLHGADTTGATGDLGAIITSLSSALHTAGGGTIVVPPGSYKFTTTGTINSTKVNLQCAGSALTKFVPESALGTSPCLDISGRTGWNVDPGGKFGGFSIDGTAVPAGVGMVYGDMIRGQLDDIFIDNYATGKGLRFLNRTHWTERTLITRLTFGNNNRTAWTFEISGGTNSFGYTRCLDCALNIGPTTATASKASVTVTAGSTSATVASGGFTGFTTGYSVDGAGLYSGTTVAGVSGNTLTLSQPAKTTGTVTLTAAPTYQTGIYVGAGAYLYSSTLTLIVNADGGTDGTNQSPLLIDVADGGGGGIDDVDISIHAESSGGKVNTGRVTSGSTAKVRGIAILAGFTDGYHGEFLQETPGFTGTFDVDFTAAWQTYVANDRYPRCIIRADGVIAWGGGTNPPDTNIARRTGGVVEIGGAGDIVTSVAAPSTASSTGKTNQIASDSSFLYICTATNTWKRVAIASW